MLVRKAVDGNGHIGDNFKMHAIEHPQKMAENEKSVNCSLNSGNSTDKPTAVCEQEMCHKLLVCDMLPEK